MTGSRKGLDAGLLALLFVLALAASLLFVQRYPLPEPKHDAALYYGIARNVASGNGFSADGVHPYAGVPPLFGALLGAWFRAVGESVPSAALFQCLVHALSAAAAYLLFRAMACAPLPAFLLSLVAALQPILLTRVAFVLQEPVLLLTTTAALAATVLWLRRKNGCWACAAGAFWGIAVLGKAVALAALPAAVVSRLAWERDDRRAALRQAVLFTLALLLVLAPWTARNYLRFHRAIPVSDQAGGALYEWAKSPDAPAAGAGSGQGSAAEAGKPTWDRRIVDLFRGKNGFPGNFPAARVVRNAIDFASPARDWWWQRGRYGPGEPREWYWVAHDLFHRFLFLVLLILVYRTLRGKVAAPRGFVALFCFFYWIEYSLVLGIPRYGLPLYPALLALLLPDPRRPAVPRLGEFATWDSAGRRP